MLVWVKYTPVSMVRAEAKKVSVLCEVRIEAYVAVEYLVYNTKWQHVCGWNKLLVCSKNIRKTEEWSQGIEPDYYGSQLHKGHLDFNRKLFLPT
jgi:hypothetical protein